MSEFADMPGVAAPLMPTDPVSLAGLDCSDRGNAARFMARYGDRFLFVRAQGWFSFTGTHWARHGAEAIILNAAAATVAAIVDEAKALEDAARRHDAALSGEKAAAMMKRVGILRKWATAAGSINRLRGMLAVAEAQLAADLSDFDTDPLAINCRNGTIRLRKTGAGESIDDPQWSALFEPHAAEDRLARIVLCAYDPAARAVQWEAHLKKVVPDWDERMFLKRMCGYAALGLTQEQAFFLWQGRGADGKSLTANVIREVLGSYSDVGDVATFLEDRNARSGGQASPDVADLAGALRFLPCSEPPKGARLNEARIKLVTGGEPMKARRLQKDPFSFKPSFKLVIQCNSLPLIGGADEGIWRRIYVMPWRLKMPRKDWDLGLERRIVADEAAGVLNWLIQGARNYLALGLAPPPSLGAMHAEYKSGANPFREWLDTYIAEEDGAVITQHALHEHYSEKLAAMGLEPMAPRSFGLALTDQQVRKAPKLQGGTKRVLRLGVRLLSDDEAEARMEAGASAVRA